MSTIKERVEDILQRPMTRQQFLKQMGLLVLAAVGITGLLNTLDPKHGSRTAGSGGDSPGSTYGSSVYAGKKSA